MMNVELLVRILILLLDLQKVPLGYWVMLIGLLILFTGFTLVVKLMKLKQMATTETEKVQSHTRVRIEIEYSRGEPVHNTRNAKSKQLKS